MVVRGQARLPQPPRLLVVEHPERRAHLHAHVPDGFGHLQDAFELPLTHLAGPAPCRAHAKSRGPRLLGSSRGGQDVVDVHELLRLELGVLLPRAGLRAVVARLGAPARLDAQERALLHLARVVESAMDARGVEHEVEQGARVQSLHLRRSPVVADRAEGGAARSRSRSRSRGGRPRRNPGRTRRRTRARPGGGGGRRAPPRRRGGARARARPRGASSTWRGCLAGRGRAGAGGGRRRACDDPGGGGRSEGGGRGARPIPGRRNRTEPSLSSADREKRAREGCDSRRGGGGGAGIVCGIVRLKGQLGNRKPSIQGSFVRRRTRRRRNVVTRTMALGGAGAFSTFT